MILLSSLIMINYRDDYLRYERTHDQSVKLYYVCGEVEALTSAETASKTESLM